jgi:hypothetical protein
VELFLTETGGHLGPVTFSRRSAPVRPFSVAPWATESIAPSSPPVIRVLRGDFFCLPFGGNETPYRGERHPVHGETANRKWPFVAESHAGGEHVLQTRLRTRVRAGRVEKTLRLVDGHNVVYCRHTVSGMSGRMNFGHHAMLKFPDAPGSGLVATSPFVSGQVFPGDFERAEIGGYSALRPGAAFTSLAAVPTLRGEPADLTRYPARRGYEDLVMLVSDPARSLAWNAVTFPREGYVWFALKDPQVLRQTVLWISNAGRHYAPWSGRHAGVMGIEDVTAYFHYGLAESAARNPVSAAGIPTSALLRPGQPLVVNYLFGIARTPRGFGAVAEIRPEGDQSVRITDAAGRHLTAAVDHGFLYR